MAGFAGFTNSEMANLVKKAGMLSPVAYLNHVTSPLIQAAAWLYIDRVLVAPVPLSVPKLL